MSAGEIWISVAATERPASLRQLVADLVEQSEEVPCHVRLLVIDNARTEEMRRATRDAIAAFSGERRSALLRPAITAGGSIARSRRDQRELVRALASRESEPAFIWMLDDDVRLDHRLLENGRVVTRRLHNHFRFLLHLKQRTPGLEVLLGEVNGDPPIPAIATYASRLEDFAWSLDQMARMEPEAPWRARSPDFSVRDDSYYDFAHTEARATARRCAWHPSSASCIAEALEEMVREACDIPFGIGFSRPILANERGFEELRDDTIRGGHAVFFSAEAFLSQRYPSIRLEGTETRRSDSLASHLFVRTRPGRLQRSAFAVRHARPREEQCMGSTESIARGLLADTWGAALTRALVSERSVSAFLAERLERIDHVLQRTRAAIVDARSAASRLPAWARASEAPFRLLDERLGWLFENVPGVREGRLPRPWREVLTRTDNADALRAFAHRLLEDPHVE